MAISVGVLLYGSLYSLDWTTGLEYWTGLLDWSTAPNFYHTDKDFTVLHTELMHYTLRGIIPIFTVSQSAAIVKV